MMKQLLPLLVIVLLAHVVQAQEEKIENFNTYQDLVLQFHIDGEINVVLTDPLGRVEEMKVDLSFFPRENGFQAIKNINYMSRPQAKTTTNEKYTTFLWEDRAHGERLEYGIDASMVTKNIIPSLTKKITFPLTTLDASYAKYTKPSPFIDITPAIEQQALTIIGGEDDLFLVVFKLADWTKNNIKYNLSTLTANAVQKSSWVLENKQGVCDEITNLFISMLRSVGIPTKFVSGMVYSNLDDKWGPHGWAEVYVPGYGWIPFDVTFGQYGWLDPTHLKLKDDTDSGSPSAEYSWKATAPDRMNIRETRLETTLLSTGREVQPFLQVDADPYKKAVAPGSVVPLLVTVENTQNVYSAPTIIITKAPGLEGSNVKQIFLHPRESKTIAWLLKIPEEAAENFIYTSAIEAVTSFGNTATTEVKYALDYPPFNKQEAEEIVNKLTRQAEKSRLDTIAFSCAPDKQIYYEDESATITCRLQSRDEETLSVKACLRTECQNSAIPPRTARDIVFTIKTPESGRFTATLESADRVAYASIQMNVIKVPEILIADIKPSTVTYGEDVRLSFALKTDTPIQDVKIDLGFDELTMESIEESKDITILTSAKNLINGVKMNLVYSDAAGKIYEDTKIIRVQINKVPWYARFIFWMASFFQ